MTDKDKQRLKDASFAVLYKDYRYSFLKDFYKNEGIKWYDEPPRLNSISGVVIALRNIFSSNSQCYHSLHQVVFKPVDYVTYSKGYLFCNECSKVIETFNCTIEEAEEQERFNYELTYWSVMSKRNF